MTGRQASGMLSDVSRPRSERLAVPWPAVLFLLIVLIHESLLIVRPQYAEITQWMLMPPLIALLILNCRSVRLRLVRLTLVALTVSWLGDSLPFLVPPGYDFVVRLGFFFVVLISLAAAFWPYRQRSILITRPQLMAPYGIAVVGLVAVCIPGAGALWPLLALYGVLLAFVSALATGLNARATWGGIFFVVADGFIAARLFIPAFDPPLGDFWAMLAYLLAQSLITLGVVELTGRRA